MLRAYRRKILISIGINKFILRGKVDVTLVKEELPIYENLIARYESKAKDYGNIYYRGFITTDIFSNIIN